jgi:hypothetical protein
MVGVAGSTQVARLPDVAETALIMDLVEVSLSSTAIVRDVPMVCCNVGVTVPVMATP